MASASAGIGAEPGEESMPLPRPISVTSQGPALVEGFPHLARIAPIAGFSIFARAGVAEGSDRVHVPWSLGIGGEVAIDRHRCRGVVTRLRAHSKPRDTLGIPRQSGVNYTLSYVFDNIGGCTRTRTLDPLIKSQLLYQLSYAPHHRERPGI